MHGTNDERESNGTQKEIEIHILQQKEDEGLYIKGRKTERERLRESLREKERDRYF